MELSIRRRPQRQGAAAVEFALVGPLLIGILIAIVVYGFWFLSAQSVQSLAAEGARAGIAGLDAAEQTRLSQAVVMARGRDMGLQPDRLSSQVLTDHSSLRVVVAYDLSDHPLLLIGGFLPQPPKTIARSAAIQIGDQ